MELRNAEQQGECKSGSGSCVVTAIVRSNSEQHEIIIANLGTSQ